MKTLKQQISEIRTMSELNDVFKAAKARHQAIRAQDIAIKKATLCVGQKVIVNGQSNVNKVGIIEKIKIKNAVVNIDGQRWNCPLTILATVATERRA